MPSVFVFSKPPKETRKAPDRHMNEPDLVPSVSQITLEHNYCFPDTELNTLKRKYEQEKKKANELSKKLRLARKQIAQKKVAINKLLSELQEAKLINDEDKTEMEHCFSDLQIELTSSLVPRQYSEELKNFACTLNLYSSKAYEFVKKKLNLPSQRTLRRWMENINGNPGICTQIFDVLKKGVDENNRAYKYCTVIFDSMSIKKYIEWDAKSNSMVGVIDYGRGNLEGDTLPMATEVLVVMAVGILGQWKAPLAYFFVDKIKSHVQARLLQSILEHLTEINVEVVGLICDGSYANQQTLQLLGLRFNPEDPKNVITLKNKEKEIEIPVILDVCHMIKLIRNIFSDFKALKSPTGIIDWQYIVKLDKMQEEEMLSIGNKLTRSHVEYHNNKMKVKLAVQLLSNSVASALKLCKKLNCRDFQNVDATVEFLEIINCLFDIFNSKIISAKGFKSPTSSKNWHCIKPFLLRAKDYLLSLKTTSDTPLYASRRKTAVIGLVNNINSLIWLYEKHVSNPVSDISYLLMYKWSQDHIELFFGCIRQCGRFCNNPTALQFKYIFKKMLFRCGVSTSKNGSVIEQSDTLLLSVSSSTHHSANSSADEKGFLPLQIYQSIKMDHDYIRGNPSEFSSVTMSVIEHIAGYVARHALIEADCDNCRESLIRGKTENYMLIALKDKGGLLYPSQDLVKAIKIAEMTVRCSVNIKNMTQNVWSWGLQLENNILQTLAQTCLFVKIRNHCDVYNFLKMIIRCFLKVRRHFASKNFSRNVHNKPIRQSLTKTILFKNQ